MPGETVLYQCPAVVDDAHYGWPIECRAKPWECTKTTAVEPKCCDANELADVKNLRSADPMVNRQHLHLMPTFAELHAHPHV